MNCPSCGSSQLRARRDGRMRCHLCGGAFYPNEVRREKVKTHAGSGVIAGKIEVGRGMREWGSGDLVNETG